MLTLPETIEREYAAFRFQTAHEVADLVDQALLGTMLRQDDEDNPDLLATAAVLGITGAAIIKEGALRRRLRRIATKLSDEKRVQLTALIGKLVPPVSAATIDEWVDQQTAAITSSVKTWLAAAAVSTEEAVTPREARAAVAKSAKSQGLKNVLAASAAILGLNAAMVKELSEEQGLTHYRWITKDDAVVRDNHEPLHGTIQAWASPPSGGGTRRNEIGHPGSGFGCRCKAEPIT